MSDLTPDDRSAIRRHATLALENLTVRNGPFLALAEAQLRTLIGLTRSPLPEKPTAAQAVDALNAQRDADTYYDRVQELARHARQIFDSGTWWSQLPQVLDELILLAPRQQEGPNLARLQQREELRRQRVVEITNACEAGALESSEAQKLLLPLLVMPED